MTLFFSMTSELGQEAVSTIQNTSKIQGENARGLNRGWKIRGQ